MACVFHDTIKCIAIFICNLSHKWNTYKRIFNVYIGHMLAIFTILYRCVEQYLLQCSFLLIKRKIDDIKQKNCKITSPKLPSFPFSQTWNWWSLHDTCQHTLTVYSLSNETNYTIQNKRYKLGVCSKYPQLICKEQ